MTEPLSHSEQSYSVEARRKASTMLFAGVEAIVVQREDSGFYSVTLNVGYSDEAICGDVPHHDWAVGIAHALDVVYRCGVYEDGRRL